MRGALLAIGAMIGIIASTPGPAAPKSPKLARCDGKARRPANLYGSILPSVDPTAATVIAPTPAAGTVDVFPPPDAAKPNRPNAPTSSGDAPSTQVPPIGAIAPRDGIRAADDGRRRH